MEIILNAVVPLFLVVLLGYLMAVFKLVKTEVAGALMQYIFYAAAPAIVIWAITDYKISQLLVWRFWIAYPLSLIIVIVLVALIFKFILRRNTYWSFLAGGASATTNTVLVGFPVLAGIVGPHAAIPMAIAVIATNVIFVPFLIFLFELCSRKESVDSPAILILVALKGTIKSPIVIGVIIGVVLAILHIQLPVVIKDFLKILGFSIGPCALFAIGLTLKEFSAKGNLLDITLITIVNLIVTPIVAIFLANWLELSPFYAVALVVLSTVPTAKTLYIFASKYKVYEKELAAVISLTTVFGVITIPAYVYVAQILWPSQFAHFGGMF